MAIYSLIEAVPGSPENMVSDDAGHLYVVSGNPVGGVDYRVYMYTISTDTLTDISANTFASHAAAAQPPALCWFADDLYILCMLTAGQAEVFEWDGPGTTTWTSRDSVGGLGLADIFMMEADEDRMMWHYGTFGGAPVLRMTENGSSYASQSVPVGYGVSILIDAEDYGELVLGLYVGANRAIAKYAGGNSWAIFSANPIGGGGTYTIIGTCLDHQFFDLVSAAEGVALYESPDWGATVNNKAPGVTRVNFQMVFHLDDVGVFIRPTIALNKSIYIWDDTGGTWGADGTAGAGADYLVGRACMYRGWLYVLVNPDGIYRRDTSFLDYAFAISPKYEAKGMDASADDDYLYVACLEGGNPVLLRMTGDLSADPVRVYNPGAGDAIAVVAGRQHDDWVWISGRFAGNNKVALSEDAGAAWAVEDPNTWAGRAYPPLIGPDNDERLLIATDQDDDLHETLDRGDAWVTQNDGLDFDVGDMDHVDIAPDELVMGRNAAGATRVEYSPSRGVAFADVTAGTPNFETTTVIVG